MALIARFARLFNADMHAVLDRIEEPEALLKQAVREMREDLARTEQRQQWLQGELKALDKKIDSGARVLEDVAEELDVCFAADQDDLARTLIRRKLTQEQRNRALQTQREAMVAQIAELESVLGERRDQLSEMQQKVDLFCDQSLTADASSEPAITADDVEIAFLKEQQHRSRT